LWACALRCTRMKLCPPDAKRTCTGSQQWAIVAAVAPMRLLAGHLLVPILAALLVLTTPVGTGQGVHENEVLHPIWAHTHVIDGRIVSDEQLAAVQASARPDGVTSQPPAGPALGAGNGADGLGLGIGVGPTLPIVGLMLRKATGGRLPLSESKLPTEFRGSPQDPPPDQFG
jgi:hypothetical protein